MARDIEAIKTPPTLEEMEIRLDKVRTLMAREELDVYVSANTENVYYLTNFAYTPWERPFFLIIPAHHRPLLVVPMLELDHARERVVLDLDHRTYTEYPAPADKGHQAILKELIQDGQTVGIESSLGVGMEKVVPGRHRIVDVIEEARLIKTDYEIGRIAYTSEVLDQGWDEALKAVKNGVTMRTLASAGGRPMMTRITSEMSHLNTLVSRLTVTVWARSLSAQPHAVPGLFDAVNQGGPHVSIVAGRADGYAAELERTFFLDHVPDEAREPFDTMMEARDLAYDRIRPGVRASDVDKAVLGVIQKRGYGDFILHRTGHGLGVSGHEGPWIAVGSEDVLAENMIVSIEPGIYIPDLGGFRHSDTVLVTKKGCQALTRSPDRLEDLIRPV